ncbi:MAG: formate dehydrogenase subunit gamma, partial [Rhodoferax sp.]|nr:formate dehydrogenase subunit gamma [Rhodoferax sp.]
LGTVGTRGAYKAMKTGYVSEGWAKEHHALWHDDVQAGKIPRQRSASQPAAATATTPSAGLPAQG